MSGNIFAVGQMSFCCLELVRYFKVKSTGRVFDVPILLEDIRNSHIPVGVRIF